MAEIQKVPRAGIKFIRGDDITLYLHAARENLLRYFVRQADFQPGEKRRAIQYAVFDDLGAAVAPDGVRKRLERVRIAYNERRLPERPNEVFPRREIDRRFPADGRIHRGEKRRRDLHEPDAALVARRGKPDHVADNAAAERNDHVAAAEAVLTEEVQHIGVGREVLAPLARGECERVHTVARLFKGLDRALAVERVDRVVRHDGGHAGGADLPEKLAHAVE